MSKINRLFLFAGYDKHGQINPSTVHYIQSLKKYGDIIACFDCTCPKKEINKIVHLCLKTFNHRHGEYDFGSYKRSYKYAIKNNLLSRYKYIYLLNDSVYGPLFDIKNTLETLESFNTSVFGLVKSNHKIYAPIESWFIGMESKISLTNWFYNFITTVKKQPSKEDVTIAYENGFTDLLNKHNINYKCMINVHGREMYNKPLKMFRLGCPFIKKSSFTRHNGAIGYQINKILKETADSKIFLSSAKRLYGDKYIDWLLTNNPIKCLIRSIKYIINTKL